MKNLLVLTLAWMVSIEAVAGELVVVKGLASGKADQSTESLLNTAKQRAVAKLPNEDFRQVSRWSTWMHSESRFQTTFVGATASFKDANDPGPYFVNSTEDRLWGWKEEEVPNLIDLSKKRATRQAEFFCNSAVSQTSLWEVNVEEKTVDGNPFGTSYYVTTTAHFQCT